MSSEDTDYISSSIIEPKNNTDYYYEKKIYYFIGRLNPPHPGHIEAIVKAYQFMIKYSPDAKMYIYVTRTQNKIPTSQKVVKLKEDISSYKSGTVGVKNKKFENPLDVMNKQYFLTMMLMNRLQDEYDEDKIHIGSVISPYRGLFEEIELDIETTKEQIFKVKFEDEYITTSDVVYFMGLDDDLNERKGREGQCNIRSDYIKNEKSMDKPKIMVDCLYIKRNSHSHSTASGMSASKIRFAAANGEFNSLKKIYDRYLDDIDIWRLIRLVRQGLNMEEDTEMKGGKNRLKKRRKTIRKQTTNHKKKKNRRKTIRKQTMMKQTMKNKPRKQ